MLLEIERVQLLGVFFIAGAIKDEADETTVALTTHICVVRLDHMNRAQKYFKLLCSWSAELQLRGGVFKVSARGGVYVVLVGNGEETVAEFLKRWRTRNVDLDSRGRPCKEKMMSVLCQERLELERQLGCVTVGVETGAD